MSTIKNLYSKWKYPAISVSIIFALTASIFITATNLVYMNFSNDSFTDFYFYTIKSLILVVIEAIVLYFFVKISLKKIKEINKNKDVILNQLKIQFENMPVGVISADPDFIIRDWNPEAERIFGYKKEEVFGKSGEILVAESKRPVVAKLKTLYQELKLEPGQVKISEKTARM